jgi:hypothetical protein
MVHVIFDGSDVKLENFFQVGTGVADLSFFEGVPARYQRGYGYFGGNYHQRGHGMGDIFRSLWRVLKPFGMNIGTALAPMAKEAGKALGEEGLATGARVLNEMVQGKNVKDSLAAEGREGVKRLLDRASSRLQRGSGGGRRRKLPGTNVILKPGDMVTRHSIVSRAGKRNSKGLGGGPKKRRQRVDSLGFY